jgi:hypothetical protein
MIQGSVVKAKVLGVARPIHIQRSRPTAARAIAGWAGIESFRPYDLSVTPSPLGDVSTLGSEIQQICARYNKFVDGSYKLG